MIFLAGAESEKYQEALLRGDAPSLQTFYARRSIHAILELKDKLDEERNPSPDPISKGKQ